MKIAFVSGFHGLKCGVAVYGVKLARELSKVAEVKVFAEKSDEELEDTKDVSYCWKREESFKINLIDEIDAWRPDLVLVNHEFGYFDKSYKYTNLVSYWKYMRYRVATIFHSVYPRHLDKLVNYSATPIIFVHSDGAKQTLTCQGINPEKIHVIRHGMEFLTEDDTLLPKLWNTWGTQTIFSFGFGFEYKGSYEFLDVLSKVKEKYPDVHYVLQFSENPKCINEHNKVYETLMLRAYDLGLLGNITVNRGFASEKEIMSHVRTSTVCVFSYKYNPDHNVFAATGSARNVMSTETPIVVNERVNLFSDLKGIVNAVTEDKMADEICKIFAGEYDFAVEREKRIRFIKDSSWQNVSADILSVANASR